MHGVAGGFQHRGVIRQVGAGRRAMRRERQVEAESLWRLHRAQAARSGEATMRSPSICLMVSVTRVAGMAAPKRSAAATARAISAVETNGRAPSWISTTSGRNGASASSPLRTLICRVSPPNAGGVMLYARVGDGFLVEGDIVGMDDGHDAADVGRRANRPSVWLNSGSPAQGSHCFGVGPPNRAPRPAATTRTKTRAPKLAP